MEPGASTTSKSAKSPVRYISPEGPSGLVDAGHELSSRQHGGIVNETSARYTRPRFLSKILKGSFVRKDREPRRQFWNTGASNEPDPEEIRFEHELDETDTDADSSKRAYKDDLKSRSLNSR